MSVFRRELGDLILKAINDAPSWSLCAREREGDRMIEIYRKRKVCGVQGEFFR